VLTERLKHVLDVHAMAARRNTEEAATLVRCNHRSMNTERTERLPRHEEREPALKRRSFSGSAVSRGNNEVQAESGGGGGGGGSRH